MIIYDQQNYSGELGTGHGVTIADSGCALCSVSMDLVNCFGIQQDPNSLDAALVATHGFAPDSNNNYDEIEWGDINNIYSGITLAFDNLYPSTPADMSVIDPQLAAGKGVIVGVSFEHDVNATEADHYVLIYKKNPDGTYQMLDPWFGDDSVYDARYAVNGMSVAQSILQAISYNGNVVASGVVGNMFKLPSGQEVDLSNSASMQVCATTWDAVVNLHQYVNVSDWNTIAADLGLPAGSTKDQVDAAIKTLQQAKSDAAASSSADATTVQNLNEQISQLKTQLAEANTNLATANTNLDAANKTIEKLQTAPNEPTTGSSYEDLYNTLLKTYNTAKAQWEAQFSTDAASFSQLKRNNIYYLPTGVIFSYWVQRATQQAKQSVPPPLTPEDFKYAASVAPPPNTTANENSTTTTK